jgi:hypothetical protein
VTRLDTFREEREHILFGNGRGREDPRAGCVARDLADCEPLAACER